MVTQTFEIKMRLAREGDVDAQAFVGYCYTFGKEGVAKDEAQAVQWYSKAAEQGDPNGQGHLGELYATGLGVTQDDAQAVQWYRRAAEQGNAKAQNNLGEMYESGRGVAKDDAQAMQWYRRAAEQGNAKAQNNLGEMYEIGRGVVQDDAQAVQWYRRAAEQGHADAQNNLAAMYYDGRGVAQDFTQAVQWFSKAATQGDVYGQANLGWMYATGRGVAKDDAQAVQWYRQAAGQGDANAQNNLGEMYENGRGVAQDNAQAVQWYRRAAEQGYADAQNNLAAMYDNGLGVAQDLVQAVQWYRRAAELGEATAQFNLGEMHENGRGVAQDLAQAVHWYRRAAEQGYADAKAAVTRLRAEMPPTVVPALADLTLKPVAPAPATSATPPVQPEGVMDDQGRITLSLEIPAADIQWGKLISDQGRFGDVYQATFHHGTVAVKKLRLSHLSADALADFKSVASIMANLNSEYTVRLFGICLQPSYCLVMEYMSKGSLDKHLYHKEISLDWTTRQQIALDVAYGLDYLHAKKILHRDLKSMNVLIHERENVLHAKLADSGLAKLRTESASTTTNAFTGRSLLWKAPESFARKPYTKESDIYGFGVMLWEIAARQLPFTGGDEADIRGWIKDGIYDYTTDEGQTLLSTCPGYFRQVMQGCWKKEPSERMELKHAIEALEKGEPEADLTKSVGFVPPLASRRMGL